MSKNRSPGNGLDQRDERTGRFLPGNHNGGRPQGSRVKLSEAFLKDLHKRWQRSGEKALEKMAESDPSGFVRVVASVLPRQLDESLHLSVDADLFVKCESFVQAFQLARKVIGAEIGRDEEAKLIEHYEAGQQ